MPRKAVWIISVALVLAMGTFALWLWPTGDGTPKPSGYLRIEAPITEVQSLADLTGPHFPYQMMVDGSAQWEARPEELGWGDLVYPWCRGRMQLTYKPVEGNLAGLIDDAHKLAFKHSVVADGIAQKLYINPDSKVYAVMFQMQGNAASAVQFFATDSLSHFIRGAAYVYAQPNADSLAPVNAFFEAEVVRFFESLEWE